MYALLKAQDTCHGCHHHFSHGTTYIYIGVYTILAPLEIKQKSRGALQVLRSIEHKPSKGCSLLSVILRGAIKDTGHRIPGVAHPKSTEKTEVS